MRWVTLSLALALPLLGGCPPPPPIEAAQDVNQDRIYQEYAAFYDGETDRTSAEAQFWFGVGGTTLTLAPPSTVVHNVVPMGLDTSFGAKYVGGTTGFFDFHEWMWTDADGFVYVNNLTMNPVSFVDPPQRVSLAGGVLLFEPPLEDGEGVVLWRIEPRTNILGSQGETGMDTVVIDPPLMDVSPGPAVVELARVRNWFTLQQATSSGGTMKAETHSEHLAVTLDP